MAFRYDGELKSIHHVERYTVIDNFATHFTPKSTPADRPHFLYDLGPAIRPTHRVPTNGNGYSIYPSGRKWIFIDLLLTAKSVAEAAHLTKQRLKEVEQDPSILGEAERLAALTED